MEELFQKAEREGLWFFCSYQQLWFSPSELRKAQSEGRFRWGAENWKLRDPQEAVDNLDRNIRALNTERERLLSRIADPERIA